MALDRIEEDLRHLEKGATTAYVSSSAAKSEMSRLKKIQEQARKIAAALDKN